MFPSGFHHPLKIIAVLQGSHRLIDQGGFISPELPHQLFCAADIRRAHIIFPIIAAGVGSAQAAEGSVRGDPDTRITSARKEPSASASSRRALIGSSIFPDPLFHADIFPAGIRMYIIRRRGRAPPRRSRRWQRPAYICPRRSARRMPPSPEPHRS